ncbi:MAG TPA: alpha/beta fold hydrolase [Candidatus Paceibacterota bacterium]
MKQVLAIHGGNFFDTRAEYLASLKKEPMKREDLFRDRSKRWKDNLGEDLNGGKAAGNFEVFQPEMPSPEDAKYEEWKVVFEKAAAFLTGGNGGAVLVGHSLGGIFLARYLSENKLKVKIAGVFLVAAPFFKPGKKGSGHPGMRANAGFTVSDKPGFFKKLVAQSGKMAIYHSEDDKVVAASHAKLYKKGMPEAELVTFKDRGHFRVEHFPELVEAIRKL